MSFIYNKKIWGLILIGSLLTPTSSMARGRDIAMAVSGAIIVGVGLTFIIKSGVTPSKESKQQSRLEIKAWNPMNNPPMKYDPIRR